MSGYGYIRGDNNIDIEIVDVTARNDIERLVKRLNAFGNGIAVRLSSASTSEVDEYLAHEITIVDGKIMDTVTGEDLSDSNYLEINSTGEYIHVKPIANKFLSFDALTEYTIEMIATDEYLEDKTGDKIFANILYSSSSFSYSKFQIGNRYSYKQYGYIYENSPQYTNYLMSDCTTGRNLNVYTERACTNEVYAAMSVSQSNASLIFNVQGKSVDYSSSLDTTMDFLPCDMLSGDTNTYFKRIRVYSKALSADELNVAFWASGTDMYGKTADGITTLGSAVLYDRLPDGTPFMIDKDMKESGTFTDGIYDYSIYDFALPETALSTDGYTDCSIYTKIRNLYVGDMVALSALPHPFTATNQYLIEWTTSDNEIVECVNGLLFAHKSGEVTITAKIFGTEISDSITITVEEVPTKEENFF